MIPPDIEIKARHLVEEAFNLGGELWRHVTPATIELLVEAVALDLQERERADDLPRPHDLSGRPSSN